MTSIPRSTLYDDGNPPPRPKRNPNTPRRNGPGATPYYSGSAVLSDDSDEDISNALAGMGLQDQRNPTPGQPSRLLSPLGLGSVRSASRPATPMPDRSPYYQRSASTRSHAVPHRRPPISSVYIGRPSSSSRVSTSQNMPSAINTPASVASQAPGSGHFQTPSAYTNSTHLSNHHGPIQPMSARAPAPKKPKRRNTHSGPGLLTEDQVEYLNTQHESTSRHSPSHSSLVSSRTSRHHGSISGRSRSASVYSGTRQTSYGPYAVVPYGHPTMLYPIVECRYQPSVVYSRTVQASQETYYGTRTYTEHQQVTIPPRFY